MLFIRGGAYFGLGQDIDWVGLACLCATEQCLADEIYIDGAIVLRPYAWGIIEVNCPKESHLVFRRIVLSMIRRIITTNSKRCNSDVVILLLQSLEKSLY